MTAILAFITTWWKLAVAFIAVASLSFLLGQCDGRKSERARSDAARAEANVQAMKTNQVATEKAAEQRVKDATTVAAQEEELIDAIQTVPDTAPDAVRVRLGCERLRKQGTNTADIPACR
jgi:hypothetical protein